MVTQLTLEEFESFHSTKGLQESNPKPEKESHYPHNLEYKVATENSEVNLDVDNTPLTFGKHKGLTPNSIAIADPHWLVWAYSNIQNKRICTEELAKWCKSRPNPRAGSR